MLIELSKTSTLNQYDIHYVSESGVDEFILEHDLLVHFTSFTLGGHQPSPNIKKLAAVLDKLNRGVVRVPIGWHELFIMVSGYRGLYVDSDTPCYTFGYHRDNNLGQEHLTHWCDNVNYYYQWMDNSRACSEPEIMYFMVMCTMASSRTELFSLLLGVLRIEKIDSVIRLCERYENPD
jgi:hypothetical protein